MEKRGEEGERRVEVGEGRRRETGRQEKKKEEGGGKGTRRGREVDTEGPMFLLRPEGVITALSPLLLNVKHANMELGIFLLIYLFIIEVLVSIY